MILARSRCLKVDARTSSREKKLHEAKNFCENVLHNFSNFVQLRTSDIGFHTFQIAIELMKEVDSNAK